MNILKETEEYLRKCCKQRIKEICDEAGLSDIQKRIILNVYVYDKLKGSLPDFLNMSDKTLRKERKRALEKIYDYRMYNNSEIKV